MKTNFVKISVIAAMMALLVTTGGFAMTTTIEGTIQGFTCLTHGKVCPVDRFDPHLSVENNFVLVGMDKGYHFMPNLDQSILARNIHKKARITGNVNPKYKAVDVKKVEIFNNGSWREVWSYEMEQEEIESWGM